MDKQQLAQQILAKYKVQGYVPVNKQPVDLNSRFAELDAIASGQTTQKGEVKKTTAEKILDFTGGKELAQGLGQAIAQPKIAKQIEETQNQQFDIQSQLLTRIKDKKALGEDTSRLETALGMIGEDIQMTGQGAEKLLNQEGLTDKEVIGDALQLATTAGGSKVAGAITGKATQATGVVRGLVQGAKTGALTGTALGASTGVSQGLQDNLSGSEIVSEGVKGAVMGGVTGGVLGGVVGAISGGIKGVGLRKAVLQDKQNAGFTPTQINKKTVEIAKQQGFDDTDIQFMQSMNKQDKQNAQKMIDLAKKAQTDKRVIERPIDIVGDNMMNRVKFIEAQNKKAGQAVNTVAKSLKGQPVNADNILKKSQDVLDDLNITIRPDGKLNFDNSVFKNTPQLQKKMEKFFTQIPRGQADAYDVHIFKKSIDELVDYGVQGEGLKGNSERVLKMLRASADDVLDQTFDSYNVANTDFRNTKMVLDEAKDLFGKKAGFSKEKGGQLLRAVFSNNNQRPRVLKLVTNLDDTAKLYGKEFNDSLIDQALFTEILEDIYGTQATTSLQGQVGRAVKGTQKVIAGIRDPIKGTGELLATGAEKAMGISDENKRKVLEALLR